MSPSDPVAGLRRRLMLVLGVDAVCLLIGAGAIYGYLSLHIVWMGAAFALAMIAGFTAQIWLVVSFARAKPR
ncbi:MAG TPA: hypothetical protein VHY32_12525 [Caulobacteraceae bacterium]|nr:hypothetical protein [Caulobacteraceae bacterium]